MTEKLLPFDSHSPLKPVLKKWKWIGLLSFAAVLLLHWWLPTVVIVLGSIYGTVVLINLAFHLGRYLKNRLFWRVRNRILASFVFVGLIPLFLILGTGFLAGYMLVGQLASTYLQSSVSGMVGEITRIGMDLSQQLESGRPASAMNAAAEAVFKRHAAQFPSLAARMARRLPDGSYEIQWSYDPQRILPAAESYPAGKWLGTETSYDGILRFEKSAYMTSLRPVQRLKDYYIEIVAPLDQNVEKRLEREKSLYAMFGGTGRTRVRSNSSGIQISVDSGESSDQEREFEFRTEQMDARSKQDPRRKVSWGALLEARNYLTGEKDVAAFAVLHAPLEVLYNTYFSGKYDMGEVLLKLIYGLLVAFAFAEILSMVLGVTISRRITRSVHDMYKGTLALQNGDLQHRIPVRRNDQLGLLAHSFNQMSASIVRLLEEVSEKKRLEQELEIAREVQASLFPKQLPQPRGLTVYGGCEPARVVSGDYYDFILEDDARLHIVVADISGKGISAALLMANLQAAMRNQLMALRAGPAEIEQSLSEVMRRLNHQIYLNSPSEKYVTLFSGRYDAETRRLYYCNAGHLPPIVLENEHVRRLEAGGTVLGLFESAQYQAASAELVPGSLLVLFTDGITEAVNQSDEEFGEERLIEALHEACMHPPEAIYRHVTERVKAWQGELKQHDDITLIVAKVN